jgi:hypothetical protein
MSAIFSECGRYRYRLERDDPAGVLSTGKTVAVIMVNPSIATATFNDHTISKVIGFSKAYRLGSIIVGNKFAYRSTEIEELAKVPEPVGPDNDRHLEQIMRDADHHLVAWGTLTKLPDRLHTRWREVAAIADRVGCTLQCLGTAGDGHPLHPQTLGYKNAPRPWVRP